MKKRLSSPGCACSTNCALTSLPMRLRTSGAPTVPRQFPQRRQVPMATSGNHTSDSKSASLPASRGGNFCRYSVQRRFPPSLLCTFAREDDYDDKRSSATARFVYVGTYTGSGYSARWNPPELGGRHLRVQDALGDDGDLTPVQIVKPASNPSFLALDPSQAFLYSVNENTDGHVSAFAIDQTNGKAHPPQHRVGEWEGHHSSERAPLGSSTCSRPTTAPATFRSFRFSPTDSSAR